MEQPNPPLIVSLFQNLHPLNFYFFNIILTCFPFTAAAAAAAVVNLYLISTPFSLILKLYTKEEEDLKP